MKMLLFGAVIAVIAISPVLTGGIGDAGRGDLDRCAIPRFRCCAASGGVGISCLQRWAGISGLPFGQGANRNAARPPGLQDLAALRVRRPSTKSDKIVRQNKEIESASDST
jgi:hypothetical protein